MIGGNSNVQGGATALYSKAYVDELKAKIAELEKQLEDLAKTKIKKDWLTGTVDIPH